MLLSPHGALDCGSKIRWQDLVVFSLLPCLDAFISLLFKIISFLCVVWAFRWRSKIRRLCRGISLSFRHYIISRLGATTAFVLQIKLDPRTMAQTLDRGGCLRVLLSLEPLYTDLITGSEAWISSRYLVWFIFCRLSVTLGLGLNFYSSLLLCASCLFKL